MFVFFVLLIWSFISKKKQVFVCIFSYFIIFVCLNNVCSGFWSLSLYYQNINLLNSKNNLLIIWIFFILLYINFFKNFFYTVVYAFIVFYLNLNFFDISESFLTKISNTSSLNLNLLNGIMLIHPIILYMFYSLFVMNIFVKTFLKKEKNCKVSRLIIIKLTILILVSLILGCLWAEQELSWGGWWSWDFVELIALTYLVIVLSKAHTSSNTLKINIALVKLDVVVIVVSILSVRFNLINSIHNFISLDSSNQYWLYLLILIGGLLVIFNLIYLTSKLTNYKLNDLIYLFVILYIYFYAISLFEFNLNIKYVYMYLIIFLSNLLAFNFFKNFFKFSFLVPFFCNFFFSLIFFLKLISIFFSKLFKNSNLSIHLVLLLLINFTILQKYVFFVRGSDYYLDLNILNYKISNFCNSVFNFIGISADVLTKNLKGVDMFSEDYFKSIFEKSIFEKSIFIELSNTSLQKTIQPESFIIYMLFAFIILSTIFVFIKTKCLFL